MSPNPMWRRYARLFGPDPAEDVKDELRFHLQAKIDDLVSQGWSPVAARQEAERQFGTCAPCNRLENEWERRWNAENASVTIGATRSRTCVHLRTLGRDPGFAAISILILALAIGANVAVFSVVNTLLLRPLPFPDSRELVWIAPHPSGCGLSCATYSADAYEELREQSRAYQDVTGYMAFGTADNLRLTGGESRSPQRVST